GGAARRACRCTRQPRRDHGRVKRFTRGPVVPCGDRLFSFRPRCYRGPPTTTTRRFPMPRHVAVLAVLCSLLAAACSPTSDGDPFTIAQTSDVTLVQITANGVGGITAATPYSEKAIQAALPGFTTEGLQSAVENGTEWVIGAFNSDGFQVLQVFKGSGGRVREVHGVTHHLQGPNGERIGMTFAQAGLSASDCR